MRETGEKIYRTLAFCISNARLSLPYSNNYLKNDIEKQIKFISCKTYPANNKKKTSNKQTYLIELLEFDLGEGGV